jgi:hypothetical protein
MVSWGVLGEYPPGKKGRRNNTIFIQVERRRERDLSAVKLAQKSVNNQGINLHTNETDIYRREAFFII